MHEWCRDIVLQLDDGESQCGDGQNLRAMNRPVPLKLSCWCHAELVGEMSPLVVVLMKRQNMPVIVIFHCQLLIISDFYAFIMMGDPLANTIKDL